MADEVAVSIKIFLNDSNKIKETIEELKNIINIRSFKTEEIGFGIKALKLVFLMSDEGGIEEVEEKITKAPNVSQVQVEQISRI